MSNIYFSETESLQFPYWDERLNAFVSKGGYALLKEITDEYFDAAYINLEHGKRHTHYTGCRGPLCKKEIRDHRRRWKIQQGWKLRTRPINLICTDELIERYMLCKGSRTQLEEFEAHDRIQSGAAA